MNEHSEYAETGQPGERMLNFTQSQDNRTDLIKD